MGEVVVGDLRHRYGQLDVLDGVSFEVAAGGFVSLVGPSGCGKSTVLRVLAGLLTPTSGHARIGAASCVGRPGMAAFMPQRDLLLPWRRALANATVGAEVRGRPKRQARAAAAALFERFGLAGFERAWPSQLSGGMRQRLALLRTFVADLDVLLLDEPFGALDAITRRDLQQWLAGVWSADRRTTVLVTHDVDEALMLSDRVVVFSPRPGRVLLSVDVGLQRPRPPELATDAAFVALKAQVLGALSSSAPEPPTSQGPPA